LRELLPRKFHSNKHETLTITLRKASLEGLISKRRDRPSEAKEEEVRGPFKISISSQGNFFPALSE
jgi:hypothetical protein